MILYLARRLAFMVLIVFSVTVITFFLSHVIPGDPARLAAGISADKAQVDAIRDDLGLDQPIPRSTLTTSRTWPIWTSARRSSRGSPCGPSSAAGCRRPSSWWPCRSWPTWSSASRLALLAATTSAARSTGSSAVTTTAAYAVPVFVLAFWLQVVFFFHLGWLPASDRLDIAATPPPDHTGFYLDRQPDRGPAAHVRRRRPSTS